MTLDDDFDDDDAAAAVTDGDHDDVRNQFMIVSSLKRGMHGCFQL